VAALVTTGTAEIWHMAALASLNGRRRFLLSRVGGCGPPDGSRAAAPAGERSARARDHVALGFVAGMGAEAFGVLWHTTMQQEIPPDKLSRVYSYDALGSIGLVPLGYAIAEPIADAIGVQATLLSAAAIGVGVTLPVLIVPDVQRLERRPAAA
jgi:hypothetical protein